MRTGRAPRKRGPRYIDRALAGSCATVTQPVRRSIARRHVAWLPVEPADQDAVLKGRRAGKADGLPSGFSPSPRTIQVRSAIRFTAQRQFRRLGSRSAIPASARSSRRTNSASGSRSRPITSQRATARCSRKPVLVPASASTRGGGGSRLGAATRGGSRGHGDPA
jgi:hypothetical protein